MKHPTKRARGKRLLVGLTVAVLGLSLASCGGSSDEPSAAATSKAAAPTDGYPFDTSDQGDDLLSAEVKTSDFGGAAPISWRFPKFYADGEADETSTFVEVDEVTFALLAVASTGSTPRAKAEELADRLRVGDEAIHDVSIGGRDWVAVVDDDDVLSQVVLLGAFPGRVVAGAGFTAGEHLDKVPPERIAELHQMVQSIQPEPAAG
jgi:hypothetical protein